MSTTMEVSARSTRSQAREASASKNQGERPDIVKAAKWLNGMFFGGAVKGFIYRWGHKMTCNYGFTNTAKREISLSWDLLRGLPIAVFEGVLAHEMIHAAMFLDAYDVHWRREWMDLQREMRADNCDEAMTKWAAFVREHGEVYDDHGAEFRRRCAPISRAIGVNVFDVSAHDDSNRGFLLRRFEWKCVGCGQRVFLSTKRTPSSITAHKKGCKSSKWKLVEEYDKIPPAPVHPSYQVAKAKYGGST